MIALALGATTSAINCRTPSIRWARPHGLELLAGRPPRRAHSRTMSPLDRAWKPGFSLDTSVFSALETFVIIALYKSTFTIPYHTIRNMIYTVRHKPIQQGRTSAWLRYGSEMFLQFIKQVILDGLNDRMTKLLWKSFWYSLLHLHCRWNK